MKKILVPFNFSPNAHKAMDFAAQLALQANAELILVNVFDVIETPFREKTESERKQYISLALSLQERLEEAKFKLEEGGLQVTTLFYAGDVIESILRAVQERKAELVVMGTLGDNALKDKLFGSVTASLIGKLAIPILAVPLSFEWKGLQNILLALNHFDVDAGVAAPVFEIAALFNAQVIVVSFTDQRKAMAVDYLESTRGVLAYKEKLQATYPNSRVHSVNLDGQHFEESLGDFINENNIDLLAMFTYRRSVVASIFNRSITKKMSYHSKIPLLAIPVK